MFGCKWPFSSTDMSVRECKVGRHGRTLLLKVNVTSCCPNCLGESGTADLAHNVVLSLFYQIGDFGMARDLMEETYYHSKGGKIPVKWTAPEVTQCVVLSRMCNVVDTCTYVATWEMQYLDKYTRVWLKIPIKWTAPEVTLFKYYIFYVATYPMATTTYPVYR